MTNETIRNKINETDFGKAALMCFEANIGQVEFYKNYSGYYIQRAGAKGFYSDTFTTEPCKSIHELAIFMNGVVLAGSVKVKYKEAV